MVASLKQKKHDCQITLIGEEQYYPYQRPPLSKKFLAGELSAERLYVKPPSFYEDGNIELRFNSRIESIDRDSQTVVDTEGRKQGWDKLVISTGARVRKLSIPGSDLNGVHYLRNINDVAAMQELRTLESWAIC